MINNCAKHPGTPCFDDGKRRSYKCIACSKALDKRINDIHDPRNNARNQEARRLLAQTGEGRYK